MAYHKKLFSTWKLFSTVKSSSRFVQFADNNQLIQQLQDMTIPPCCFTDFIPPPNMLFRNISRPVLRQLRKKKSSRYDASTAGRYMKIMGFGEWLNVYKVKIRDCRRIVSVQPGPVSYDTWIKPTANESIPCTKSACLPKQPPTQQTGGLSPIEY